ncbi:MAG: hypothetical protein AAF184_14145 [Pseudomonadota bacterium]
MRRVIPLLFLGFGIWKLLGEPDNWFYWVWCGLCGYAVLFPDSSTGEGSWFLESDDGGDSGGDGGGD